MVGNIRIGGSFPGAAAGGKGTVTEVDVQAGPFLAVGTITTKGTVTNSSASLTAHGVLLGEGTSPAAVTAAGTDGQLLIATTSADPAFTTMGGDATITKAGAVTVARINGNPLASTTPSDANLLIANGSSWASVGMSGDATITKAGVITVTKVGGVAPATVAGLGLAINSGTITAHAQNTSTLTAGATTIAVPGTLTNLMLVGPAAGGACTVSFAGASSIDQRILVNVSQGATAATWTFPNLNVGTTVATPTITAVANKRDQLFLINNVGTVFDLEAINQGFSP